MTQVLDITTGAASGWAQATDHVNRGCMVDLIIQDVCEVDEVTTLVDATEGAAVYETRPFSLVATLALPNGCAQPDDEEFLRAGLKDAIEFAVARAFITAPPADSYAEGRVWIGHEDVTTVPRDGNLGVAIGLARSVWFGKVFGLGNPVLYLDAALVPSLSAALVVSGKEGEIKTAWGDDVAAHAGFTRPGETVAQVPTSGVAFWAPKMIVTVTSIDVNTDYTIRSNRQLVQANVAGTIDVPPCSIVQVATQV